MKKGISFLSMALFVCFILLDPSTAKAQKTKVQKAKAGQPASPQVQPIGPKKRIIVSEFENRTAYGERRLGIAISDMLVTELVNTNYFVLLEREKLNTVMKEQVLGQSGMINENAAPKLGQLLGANAIITGSVTEFGVRTESTDIIITSGKKQIVNCVVDVRVVDTSTGEITWAGSGKGEAIRKYTNVLGSGKAGGYDEKLESDAYRASIVNLMGNLVKALNSIEWTCIVADVSGEKIYVNAGKSSNLELNKQVNIFELGKPIMDPASGKELGREETMTGEASVVSYLGDNGSVLKLTSGKMPKKGDICKLK
jgi:curli biogenesis system outer membrane secretion channel CsgG